MLELVGYIGKCRGDMGLYLILMFLIEYRGGYFMSVFVEKGVDVWF